MRRFAVLAAAALTAVTVAAAAVDDKGMLDLYELESLTVVYPGSPAADRQRNRLSAERRAAFLAAGTGVSTTVVSDDELSGDRLQGDLLLLGWNNRLLARHGKTPPWGKSSVSVRFLDLVRQDPDLDLVLKCRSPFSPDEEPRFLFFWSRIDPDRDRFMTLPAVGSDWAMFSDYVEVAQGMLEDDLAWPPVRDPIAEKLTDPDIAAYTADRVHVDKGPIRVIYNPNRVERETAEEILNVRLAAHDQVVRKLGDPGEGFRLRLYLYADSDTKMKLTGVEAGAHSLPQAGEMHMTVRFGRSGGIHEDIHPVAGRLLGPTASTAAYEGLAYALEPVLMGKPLTWYAAMLLRDRRMPAIADLLDEERFRKMPGADRFSSAGLLMSWLLESASMDRLAGWYTAADPSPALLAGTLGLKPDELDARFADWLKGKAAGHSGDVQFQAALQEARNHHLLGDHEQLAAALTRALTHKPEDRQTRFNLATALMRTGDYESAAAQLVQVLEEGGAGALTAHARLQLGRVYDLMGRREEGLQAYRQVLELPDRHDSHQLAREGLERPFTADRLE